MPKLTDAQEEAAQAAAAIVLQRLGITLCTHLAPTKHHLRQCMRA
jgi:hypothetical protein